MKYRKKPVVIDADQWLPNDRTCRERAATLPGAKIDGDKLLIATLEGTMTASPGDWVIRGVSGEYYPCKPDIFEATYEPVPQENAEQSQTADNTGSPKLPDIEESMEKFAEVTTLVKEVTHVPSFVAGARAYHEFLVRQHRASA